MSTYYKFLTVLIIVFSFNYGHSQIGPTLKQTSDNTIKADNLSEEQFVNNVPFYLRNYFTIPKTYQPSYSTEILKNLQRFGTSNIFLIQTPIKDSVTPVKPIEIKELPNSEFANTMYLNGL